MPELVEQLSSQLSQNQPFFTTPFRNKVMLMVKVCDLAYSHPDPNRRTVIAHGDTYGCDFVTYPGPCCLLLTSAPAPALVTEYSLSDDPLVCHSSALFNAVKPNSVLPRDAMAQARLGVTTQKRVVYGTCSTEDPSLSCRDWLMLLSSRPSIVADSVSIHTLTWTGW
ncbi:hypothetical protein BCR44DRAFT_304974 [Catenaria anguillulae PL171]|uniref:Uncharacterized protein n=1 Tax=Catenaria anguillulae PL171 TaxID=765915 RepID=A0A1Y2I383_9FUNG|nr:hypothetical protein BCR44DRAFT_304974 [Catenaria anguillulae PL171]